MNYSDRPDTSAYPTYELSCGHAQPIDPQVVAAGRSVWCRPCALHVNATAQAEPAVVEPHDRDTEDSKDGRFARVTCSCGFRGDWRPYAATTLQRLLHADNVRHTFTIKRSAQ